MLCVSHLAKQYAGRPALDDVSLSVESGERVALLGHNGAGKSTLMKLALGLLRPDGGRIEVAGRAPGSPAARAATAYLPENAAFHPALTGREQIAHFLRLRGRPAREAPDLLARVGLAEASGRRIGTYSKGMRQRVGLAQALIGAPRLMLLDEPTSGLDPVSRREFYALLDGLAAGGTAILLSSHALSELEARTDRILVLSRGRLVASGTLAQLRAEAALPLTATLQARPGAAQALAARFPEATAEGARLTFPCAPADKLAVLERVAAARDLVADFDLAAPGLDDLYSHISRRAA